MRVTCTVRDYVKKAVLAKVAGRLKAAEDAAAAAKAARNAKVAKAEALCERLCAEAQAKFAKEVGKLGLTLVADTYDLCGDVDERGGNRVIRAGAGSSDFAETMSRDCPAARRNPNAERARFYELVDEPGRIRDAADAAADRLLFELELGKVAKKALDETLKGLEVAL